MRFTRITLQNFRNLPLVQVTLRGRRTFLCGQNAQGKTNFIEAAGYVTALRSFRGAETRALIALGQPQAGMAFSLEHEQYGESRITVTLTSQGRDVMWEQGKVTRLAEFIGKFPTVTFSSQDNQFLRGSPSLRRRWLDLTLAAMDASYLTSLQAYTRAVAERNMLLKQGGRDAGALDAFEHELAGHAVVLFAKRAAGVQELSDLFRAAHAKLVPEGEQAGLVYSPDTAVTVREEFAALLVKNRPRDTLVKSTERGLHRDDLEVLLNGRPAKQFASEGQQRCLVIALRLAQAAYFKLKCGLTPVLLCDDVLGELDPSRRVKFWNSLEGDPQVIASGTSLPEADAASWQVLTVEDGKIL
ncbi:DNA replication/repair protein RecF [Oleiharenicola lentus]|uniref:DNA replication/repair protein RecF n=1 Tax=Oleiharenicola lentus TaxID=2508720 RepID=UPI003F67D463